MSTKHNKSQSIIRIQREIINLPQLQWLPIARKFLFARLPNAVAADPIHNPFCLFLALTLQLLFLLLSDLGVDLGAFRGLVAVHLSLCGGQI